MSIKVYQNLLIKLNNARPARKLSMAQENGFESVEDYKKFLSDSGAILVDVVKEKETVIMVDVVDTSGSMGGSKISAVNEGVGKSISAAKLDNNVNIKYGVYEFNTKGTEKFLHPIDDVQNIKFESSLVAGGGTYLYGSLIKLFNSLGSYKNNKVLVNIYTDGEDVGSTGYELLKCKELISKLNKENFTITFVGTERDVKCVVRSLSIDISNTLAYNGTGEGLQASISSTIESRSIYSANVAAGVDVSKGFYKQIIKK